MGKRILVSSLKTTYSSFKVVLSFCFGCNLYSHHTSTSGWPYKLQLIQLSNFTSHALSSEGRTSLNSIGGLMCSMLSKL